SQSAVIKSSVLLSRASGLKSMFPDLNSILNSSPENFREGEFILLSDKQADASFLVHHYLTFYLRAGCRVCFLGLVQSFSHYSVVSQRLGVNLTQAKERGQLVFVEGLKASPGVLLNEDSTDTTHTFDYLRSPSADLRGLFQLVFNSLSQSGGEAGGETWGPPVLIVDDLSVLLSLGVRAGAILDFTHYCQAAICSQLQGCVVTLVRCDNEEWEEDDDGEGSCYLLKALTHQCSLSLHVEGLSTGYCRDIHGQSLLPCFPPTKGQGSFPRWRPRWCPSWFTGSAEPLESSSFWSWVWDNLVDSIDYECSQIPGQDSGFKVDSFLNHTTLKHLSIGPTSKELLLPVSDYRIIGGDLAARENGGEPEEDFPVQSSRQGGVVLPTGNFESRSLTSDGLVLGRRALC
ncbi:hypothetical protein NFI96_021901, partial [Prochilodus magdalenae]